MSPGVLPFERYPGIVPLFLDFARGRSPFHPDPPTMEAAETRGREVLGRRSRIPAAAFRSRGPAAKALAEELAAGRAVAVIAGHQVGLFTGPLFTLIKAFDAIRVARELTERGLPAAAVFWALTDDHDLEEVAKTARPGPEGPEVLVLEGADRANRHPVGGLPLPSRVREIVEAFRPDARDPESERLLEDFAARYAPGASYGEAFLETLLDLVEPAPLLIVDPLHEALRAPSAEFFSLAAGREAKVRETLRDAHERVVREKGAAPVAYREDVFPFFEIREGVRRRVRDPRAAAESFAAGKARVSADVLTRPVLKACLLPLAASVLGSAEIAYHVQALPLFPVLDAERPVLLPRSHLILRGPAERRAAKALGISEPEILSPAGKEETESVPAASELERMARAVEEGLERLAPEVTGLDASLVGALENTRRKVAHQLEQLGERIRKASGRKDEVALGRRRRLETMLLPGGQPAERLYPPLVPLLAHGRKALEAIRDAARGAMEGAVIVDLGLDAAEGERKSHAG